MSNQTELLNYIEIILSLFYFIGFRILCLFGILGNLLVIGCILCIKKLRCNTNMFLASLAFADMMFIVFGACIYPLTQSDSLNSNSSSRTDLFIKCQLLNYTPFFVGICSSFNLAMVSIGITIILTLFLLLSNLLFQREIRGHSLSVECLFYFPKKPNSLDDICHLDRFSFSRIT